MTISSCSTFHFDFSGKYLAGIRRIVRLLPLPGGVGERAPNGKDGYHPPDPVRGNALRAVFFTGRRGGSFLTGTALPSSVRADDIRPSKAARHLAAFLPPLTVRRAFPLSLYLPAICFSACSIRRFTLLPSEHIYCGTRKPPFYKALRGIEHHRSILFSGRSEGHDPRERG